MEFYNGHPITQEDKLKTSVFFIEATSCEQFYLWKEWNKECNWQEDNFGHSQIIGFLDKKKKVKPINISFSFAKIFGKRICFYTAISRFIDQELIREWLDKNYPVMWDNGKRRAIADAQNFHLAVDRCKNQE